MRVALLTASLLLVAGGASACGGDSDSGGDQAGSASSSIGTGASQGAFCTTYKKLAQSLGDVDQTELASDDAARKAYVAQLKSAVAELVELGAPSSIGAAALRGFASSIRQIQDLPDEPTAVELTTAPEVSAADAKDQAAFGAYLRRTCPQVTG